MEELQERRDAMQKQRRTYQRRARPQTGCRGWAICQRCSVERERIKEQPVKLAAVVFNLAAFCFALAEGITQAWMAVIAVAGCAAAVNFGLYMYIRMYIRAGPRSRTPPEAGGIEMQTI
jgi:hypothetical protein